MVIRAFFGFWGWEYVMKTRGLGWKARVPGWKAKGLDQGARGPGWAAREPDWGYRAWQRG